eukprot:3333760-Rhodomonas_salina.2
MLKGSEVKLKLRYPKTAGPTEPLDIPGTVSRLRTTSAVLHGAWYGGVVPVVRVGTEEYGAMYTRCDETVYKRGGRIQFLYA